MGNIKEKIFEFLDAGVIVFDVNCEIAVVNQYVREMAYREDMQRTRLSDYFDIEDAAIEKMFMAAVDDIYSVRL